METAIKKIEKMLGYHNYDGDCWQDKDNSKNELIEREKVLKILKKSLDRIEEGN